MWACWTGICRDVVGCHQLVINCAQPANSRYLRRRDNFICDDVTEFVHRRRVFQQYTTHHSLGLLPTADSNLVRLISHCNLHYRNLFIVRHTHYQNVSERFIVAALIVNFMVLIRTARRCATSEIHMHRQHKMQPIAKHVASVCLSGPRALQKKRLNRSR